ncbi:hypothetical protein GCM10023320_80710 [Pseudonocardia adelaidensis]|uniref:Uncharacterized protein n=1 Tax=Pseudonocardia adelaidensis TaxID=648754 RepID=A0ABP9P9R0_9PSEU
MQDRDDLLSGLVDAGGSAPRRDGHRGDELGTESEAAEPDGGEHGDQPDHTDPVPGGTARHLKSGDRRFGPAVERQPMQRCWRQMCGKTGVLPCRPRAVCR